MRTLQTAATPGRIATIEGKPYLFFSGFSYLGMHEQPAFRELLKTGADTFGTGFLSSRAGNLRLGIYEELEHALGVLFRQQAAAAYSSGYLAAQAAVHYAQTQGKLLYAPHTHPALHLNGTVLPQQSWEDWVKETLTQVNAQPDHTFVLVADAVNPLTSTVNDFSWLSNVERKVMVVIDDSHGAGILGPEGEGIVYTLPLHAPVRYLLAASLAKAYSVEGGMVAGHAADIAALKRQPFFTASTPMAPGSAFAFLQSKPLYARRREQLRENIRYFRGLTEGHPLLHNPYQLPVFLLQPWEGMPDLEQYLLEHDIIISSFAYPDPTSRPIQRVVVSALHKTFDMDTLGTLLTTLH